MTAFCYECDSVVVGVKHKAQVLIEAKSLIKKYMAKKSLKIIPEIASKSDQNAKSKPQKSSKPTKSKLPGISNLGNTCYLASTLQCLFRTPSLQKLFVSGTPVSAVSAALINFYAIYASNSTAAPTQFFKSFRKNYPHFGYDQQDSHEFMHLLFSSLDSIYTDTFKGKFESIFKCSCGKEWKSTEEFWDLSLGLYGTSIENCLDGFTKYDTVQGFGCNDCMGNIPASVAKASVTQLEEIDSGVETDNESFDILNTTESIEIIDSNSNFSDDLVSNLESSFADLDVNSINTEEIHLNSANGNYPETIKMADSTAKLTTLKKYSILNLPQTLVIHLKRFNHLNNRAKKINGHISFPELLDMQPFLSSIWEGNCVYKLFGIVCHSGSLSGGHYVSYTRVSWSEVDEVQWVYASDSSVIVSSLDHVLKSQAYVLFYEKM